MKRRDPLLGIPVTTLGWLLLVFREFRKSLASWVWDSKWVEALRWRQSQKHIRGLETRLSRRGLLLGVPSLLLARHLPAPTPLPLATREAIIGEYLKTKAGRERLAQAMIQLLRTTRDYASIGRKAFLIDQVG